MNINDFAEDFKTKLEMISDGNTYAISIRRLIIEIIEQSIEQLSNEQMREVTKVSIEIIQSKSDFEICELLKKVVRNFNPFVNNIQQTDTKIIQYITSTKGKSFLKLLTSLNKYEQKFIQLSIQNRLGCFKQWWRNKVEGIAKGVEDFITVDQLSKQDLFNKINKLYRAASSKPIETRYMTAARENLERYLIISNKRNVINIFMAQFAPQPKFHGIDIKKLAKLQKRLSDWNATSLNDILSINCSIYDNNEKLLEKLAKDSTSKIKVSVFKSIIEAQQSEWTLKPLKNFTTRDAVQWLRGMIKEFEEREIQIGVEYLVECFYRHEVKGKVLIAADLDENKVSNWFKNEEENKETEEFDNVAAIIIENIARRKQQDEQLKAIKDEDKKYNFDSLEREHQKLGNIIGDIAKELSLNNIKVSTTQTYLSALAQEKN